MRHKAWQIAAVMAAAGALVFAGCGDDEESGGGGGGGGEEAAKGKVGVILPDAASSARWETADRTFLGEAFEAAGVEYDIQNANGDKAKFATIADQMISGGVTVLMLVNLDSPSAATVIKKARDQGIPSIDYDRLTLGGGADYYVSFDNVAVGTTIGEGLVQLHAGERRRLGSGGAAQRLADRQQRDAVQAGLREGDHGRRLRGRGTRPCPTGTTRRPARSSSRCTRRPTATSSASRRPMTASAARWRRCSSATATPTRSRPRARTPRPRACSACCSAPSA